MGDRRRGGGARSGSGNGQPGNSDRDDRGRGRAHPCAQRGADSAVLADRFRGGRGRTPPPLPLPGPQESEAATEPADPGPAGHRGPRPSRRTRFSRSRDPVSDQVHPGRRPRLPGAVPGPPQPLLRAPAVTAALQAVADDRGDGSLLPDRPLLPGRGPARRPPAGVHPGGRGDVLRRSGTGHRDHRRPLRAGARRGGDRGQASFPPFHLPAGDGPLRGGPPRPPLRRRDHRSHRTGPAARAIPCWTG